jgi:Na+-translocating ferredoxin:NAD+ oxidoreductase RnfE subunit
MLTVSHSCTHNTEDFVLLQSSLLGNNPFAVLTAIVAPAILTNASSVLALGTGNRLGRVVDRTRVVFSDLAAAAPGSLEHRDWLDQLATLRTRAQMLLQALRLFYAALGLFASSALVSVGGSIATYYGHKVLFEVAAGLAVLTGASAVTGLAVGCSLMVNETRLAVQTLAREAEIRIQHSAGSCKIRERIR